MKQQKFDYAYVIIAFSFLSVGISLGFGSNTRSLYLTAVTEALGFSRGAFAISDTFRFVSMCIVSFFFGVLVAKFGTKKLLLFGFSSMIAFALLSAYTTEIVGFYLAGSLLGVGLSFASTSMASVLVNKWCTKNKGTITGIVFASGGLGSAVAAQVLSPIIYEEGNPFGYRNSYRLIAVIFAVFLVLLLLFFREAPKGANETADAAKKKARGSGWVGMEFSEIVKKPYFYLAIGCMLLAGMALQSVYDLSTPHLYDIGLSKSFVATLLTISSIGLLFSKFFAGVLFDRFGIRLTMNLCFVCSILAVTLLLLVTNSAPGRATAVAYKIIEAFGLPLETVMLPLFASELFGNKSFDKTVGFFVSANYAGYALGSPIANIWHDCLGSYVGPMIFFLVVLATVTVIMNFVARAANRDKRRILEQLAQPM